MTTLLAVAVNWNVGELEEAGWGVVKGGGGCRRQVWVRWGASGIVASDMLFCRGTGSYDFE